MSNKKRARRINNNVGLHCDTLIRDFFNFVEGRLEEVKVIIDLRDISDPMPPKVDQTKKMLARCDHAWRSYCDFMMLPKESRKLFINRVKKQWLALEQQQKQIPLKRRAGKAEEPQ